GVEILDGVASAAARHVDEVDEYLRPLEMTEKLMPQPKPAVRPFDQARDVCDDKTAVLAEPHHAQIRRQSCKRVVGNFRPRRRDSRNQCGLPRIRKANEPDIREELQFEMEKLFFAWFAWLHFSRSAIGGGGESCVPHAAAATTGHEHTVAFVSQ